MASALRTALGAVSTPHTCNVSATPRFGVPCTVVLGDGRTFGSWTTPLDERNRVTSTASVSIDLSEWRTRERDLLEVVRARSADSRTTGTTVSATSLPGLRCL